MRIDPVFVRLSISGVVTGVLGFPFGLILGKTFRTGTVFVPFFHWRERMPTFAQIAPEA